jgi:hypothetical protein
VFLGRRPVLAGDGKRRLDPRRLPLDHGKRLARLAHHHRRHAGFKDAGFLRGDRFDRVAEEIAMIERQPCDHAGDRSFDDIGGVKASAEPDFEQKNVGGMPREQQERRRRLDFEYGDRRIAVLGFAFAQRRGEFIIADQAAAAWLREAVTLVEPHQIGRGVNVHALFRGFEDRARKRDGRALAVGPGHMDQRRQTALGMAERG